MLSCFHTLLPRYLRSYLLSVFLGLLSSPLLALEMTIIPLTNANAEQLITVIQAQLGAGSSVTQYQNQIILNATEEETARIKNLISTLDTAGKQLLISVKNNTSGTITNSTGSISNNGIGDNGIRITRNGMTETTTTLQHRTTNNVGSGQQGIRATEGQPSYISTGSAMAYNQPVISSNGSIIQGQQWQQAQTGFYATTWVNGDNVSIHIEQQKQSFNSNASMNNQQLQTQVHGKLGQWIAIGNLDSQDINNTRSLNSMGRTKDVQNNTIYLKVELAE